MTPVPPDSGTGPDPGPAVTAALREELSLRRAELTAIDPRLDPDAALLSAFVLNGGKQLRPRFLCWGYRAGSVTIGAERLPDPVVRAAAALELIQACALIHDDLIDRSDTRRGRPSTHRAVAKMHAEGGWSGDADHYGTSIALLLGDLSLAWADDLYTAAAAELGALARALPPWRAMRLEVLGGQMLDVRVGVHLAADAAGQDDDAMLVNRYKTAAYTVERPLHLGAALAGTDPATVAALRGYGSVVGVAFQLRDDLLGVFGDSAVTGKPAGDDLVDGKRTSLVALTRLGLADRPDDLARFDADLGNRCPPETVAALTALISSSGARERVEQRIHELTARGIAALDAWTATGQRAVPEQVAAELRNVAIAMTTRTR